MEKVTRTAVMNFWKDQTINQKNSYQDSSGEWEYTRMGEEAAAHFGVMSDDGQTDIEQNIFDWATEFKL